MYVITGRSCCDPVVPRSLEPPRRLAACLLTLISVLDLDEPAIERGGL